MKLASRSFLDIATPLLFMVAGIIAMAISVVYALVQIRVIWTWPEVTAEVMRSEIASDWTIGTDGTGSTTYKLVVDFRYSVAGKEYLSTSQSDASTGIRSWMQRKAARYTPGSFHSIRYNPADPGHVLFDAGYNLEFFAGPLIAAALGAFIFWMARYGLRRALA